MNEITELRQKRELTKMALSRELGISVQAIRAWEKGRHKPSPISRRLIKELYGVEIKKEVHNEQG